jgi:DNA-binding MarR family transcriptional regulator
MAHRTSRRAESAAEELRRLLGALIRRLRAESAGDEASPSELLVLKRLVDVGPSTTAELARAERVRPQSMGATLAGLEERGLVARAIDTTDARRRTISITSRGKRLVQAGRDARRSWLAHRIEEALDADEQRALAASLDLLRRLVEP